MQTREKLLNGLTEAVNIIRQLANIQQRLNNVRASYRNTRPLKRFSLIGKILIVFWTFIGLWTATVHPIGPIIYLLFMVLPHYLFFAERKKKNNERIEIENKRILENNEQLKIQEHNVLNELRQIQIIYQERLSSWYPINYCSVDAVEFFYNAVNNYRADNLKEAINLYEITLHQRRIEANQRQAIREQQLSNLLSAQHIAVQQQQVDALNKQTASINNVNDSLNRIYRGY